jgi:hypothetical protein
MGVVPSAYLQENLDGCLDIILLGRSCLLLPSLDFPGQIHIGAVDPGIL